MVHFLKTTKSVKIYEKSKQTIKIRTKWGTFTMRAYVLLFKNQKKTKTKSKQKTKYNFIYVWSTRSANVFENSWKRKKKQPNCLNLLWMKCLHFIELLLFVLFFLLSPMMKGCPRWWFGIKSKRLRISSKFSFHF